MPSPRSAPVAAAAEPRPSAATTASSSAARSAARRCRAADPRERQPERAGRRRRGERRRHVAPASTRGTGALRRRAGGGARPSRGRAPQDDGYRCELVPGSALLQRRRAPGRGDRLRQRPPAGARRGAAGPVRARSARSPRRDLEQRDLDVLPDRLSLAAAGRGSVRGHPPGAALAASWAVGRALPDARRTSPLGPRTSHDPARGAQTLLAYRHWVAQRRDAQAAGVRRRAEPGRPQRRFERVFERLALPGFGRMGRYDLLVTLGRLRPVRAARRLAASHRARRGSGERSDARWPPSACSGSAIRSTSSAARGALARGDRRCRSKRSTWRSPTGSARRAERATLGFGAEHARSRTRCERSRATALEL